MKLKEYIAYYLGVVCTCLIACDKMDSTYAEYIAGGEKTYIGKVDSLKAFAGQKRIKLAWLAPSDPKGVKMKIYWNNRADSVEQPIVVVPGTLKREIVLPNMSEGAYLFDVITFDTKGNASLVQSVAATSYGDSYASTLQNPALNRSTFSKSTNTATVEWYTADAGAVFLEFLYRDKSNVDRRILSAAAAKTVALPNFSLGSPVQYRTLFLPETTAVDTFYTAYANTTPALLPQLLSQQGTGVVYTASKRTAAADVVKAFDGNPTTFWNSTGAGFPEWVQVDLGSVKKIQLLKVQFHERTNNVYSYKIDISNTPPGAMTALVPVGSYQGKGGAYLVKEHVVNATGRYVRITLTGNSIASQWASLAEFEVRGDQ